MHFLQIAANPEQTCAGIDLNVNRAAKLMRIYNETLGALTRYRRKGQQEITVQYQHIKVSDGGQAILMDGEPWV